MKYPPNATAPLHCEERRNARLVTCPLNDCKSFGADGVTPSMFPTPSIIREYRLAAIQYILSTDVLASS